MFFIWSFSIGPRTLPGEDPGRGSCERPGENLVNVLEDLEFQLSRRALAFNGSFRLRLFGGFRGLGGLGKLREAWRKQCVFMVPRYDQHTKQLMSIKFTTSISSAC